MSLFGVTSTLQGGKVLVKEDRPPGNRAVQVSACLLGLLKVCERKVTLHRT